MSSTAAASAQQNLKRVTDILSFHEKVKDPKAGAPARKNASLVLGATALTYAAWESYVEQLAVEAAAHLAACLSPGDVPTSVRTLLAERAKPWSLTGEGWRKEWKALVNERAYGDGSSSFGLNTAGVKQVKSLFAAVGVDPFDGVSWQKTSTSDVKKRIQKLVRDRGTVVHTAQLPASFGLSQARAHRDFVERLVPNVDVAVSGRVEALAGTPPW